LEDDNLLVGVDENVDEHILVDVVPFTLGGDSSYLNH